MTVIDRPSPNFDKRTHPVDTLILHYTGMQTGEAALARLCEAASKVSAHYLVEEDGRIFRLVAEENRAWHAGVSSWRGDANINDRSVGMEIVNPGHEWGYRAFPEPQMKAVIALTAVIRARHAVAPTRVLGHSDVAPRRKEDPGELFPWKRLADAGHAVSPFGADAPGDASIAYEDALAALSAIGYDAPPGDHAAALLAFQRRFCPSAMGQGFDPVTKAALMEVARAFA